MTKILKIALCAALLVLPLAGNAATVALVSVLNSSQEVPPNGSSGLGSAAMLYDTETNKLTWAILFTGLSGPIASPGAHFHGPAPAGSNAGVQVDILANSTGDTSPIIGMAFITEEQEVQLLNDMWYINLHTAAFPGGEIRGQVLVEKVVPIPAAVWLFGSALLGIGGLRRRA